MSKRNIAIVVIVLVIGAFIVLYVLMSKNRVQSFSKKEVKQYIVDSDTDGLSDEEEVATYVSDPENADTDGDGYNDGQEVEGGFNPAGWGELAIDNIYRSKLYGFAITYPKDFQVLNTRSPLNDITFGREEIFKQGEGYDGEFFVFVFDQSETTVEKLVSDMGRQFGKDRAEKRENIMVSAVPALKVTVTTATVPDWDYESVFIERGGKIYWMHNGAMKNDSFEAFYNSFTFI